MAELINIEASTEGAISSSKEDEDIKKSEPSTSDENSSNTPVVPESPKPLAFTIDFGERKPVDTNRFKNMLEKYQNRHRRGQSLSKIQSPKELTEVKSKPIQKPPSSANFPRKTDYHSEGYFSSDQEDKSDASFLRQLKMLSLKSNVMNSLKQPNLKSELTLPLQNTTSQRLSESKHNFDINHITSPEMDLKDISSPEFDILTPSDPTPCMVKSMPEFTTTTASTVKSPRTTKKESQSMFISFHPINNQVTTAVIQPKNKILAENIILNNLTDISKRNVSKPVEEDSKSDVEEDNYDIEDSDSVSEAGTYTLDADNYTEEQKARMSIDREINVAPEIPALQRTQQFVESTLQYCSNNFMDTSEQNNIPLGATSFIIETSNSKKINTTINEKVRKNLSPQDSLTQISIEGSNNTINIHSNLVKKNVILNNLDSLRRNKKNTNKILFASSKARNGCGLEQEIDTTGSFTSITTCGVFNREQNYEKNRQQTTPNNNIVQATTLVEMSPERKSPRRDSLTRSDIYYENIKQNIDTTTVNNKKPPMSPTKIPSPVHSLSRPRSRASLDLSDSSVETDSYLKHTQNVITSLQARLQSDHQSTNRYDQRNNKLAQNIIKNQTKHIRHNSFDSKNTSNKLENFQSKVLQPTIDQTNLCTPAIATRSPTHKLYNSPNNSPIKRSSSFSVKQMSQSYGGHPTDFNAYVNSPIASPRVLPKDTNLLRMSPNLNDTLSNAKVHRSSSTASIRKHLNPLHYRRNSANSPENHQRQERSSNESINQKRDKTNQILITSESSSDDEFGGTNNMFIRNKEFNNLTNTRHNRAFSLRRARLDLDHSTSLSSTNTSKCPNTPEMRRKFIPNPNTTPEPIKKVAGGTSVRSASIDSRKPNFEVKSRYMNITKSSPVVQTQPSNITKTTSITSRVNDTALNNKNVPSNRQVAAVKSTVSSVPSTKNTAIARTDSGRFSMRTSRPKPMTATPKSNTKKGNRSNSTLTSREVEFQNWKRRKSYDPMKAAAEGKRKAELNKKISQNNANIMTQSYTQTTQECDSSPSHSSSVHRSQSFHGTGGLDNYISSDEDLTLSVDDADGITPPVPTPIRGSPDKIVISQSHIKQAWGAKNTRY